MRISDWSSDLCSSDLPLGARCFPSQRQDERVGARRASDDIEGDPFGPGSTPRYRAPPSPAMRVSALRVTIPIASEGRRAAQKIASWAARSEEHTSDPVTNAHLVCRLLLEKKKQHSHSKQIPRHSLPDNNKI